MYTYYQKFESEEHMLFSHEIADIYNKIYRLIGTNLELTDRKVISIISKYHKKYLMQQEKFYYNTRNGLRRVYSRDIVDEAIREYIGGSLYGKRN